MSARKQAQKGNGNTRHRVSAFEIKSILLERNLSIAALGRTLRPPRPRSTVSQAIHTKRFPRVRRQIKEALCL